MNSPALVVFDLDFTLWDCGGTWCDCLSPPFRNLGDRIEDQFRRVIRLYDEVHRILDHCDDLAIPMALASRTEQPAWARQLVELLELTNRFAFAEIYPTSKVRHFRALRQASQVPYDQMLFFDDELRNIREISPLGVTCVHVEDGLNHQLFHRGIDLIQAG